MSKLTNEEIELIITSLSFTKTKFENYTDYPSYEFKLERLALVDSALSKMREIKQKGKLEMEAS